MEYTKCIYTLNEKMRDCKQTEVMSILEHGVDVNKKYQEIVKILKGGMENIYCLPEQLFELFQMFPLLEDRIINHYQIYHDCGKPLCKIVDEEGRQHFPDHSKVSYEQFKLIFPDKDVEAFMVLHDMDFHTLCADDLKGLAISHCGFSLYLTAWAELISNALMFGGFDSTSYKIKRKKLVRNLKAFN